MAARDGSDPRYAEQAYNVGRVADGALDAGGRVTGVIPQYLVDGEVAHQGIPQLEIVDSLHER